MVGISSVCKRGSVFPASRPMGTNDINWHTSQSNTSLLYVSPIQIDVMICHIQRSGRLVGGSYVPAALQTVTVLLIVLSPARKTCL